MTASRTTFTLAMLILFISMLISPDFAASQETSNGIIRRRELGVFTSALKLLRGLLRPLRTAIDIYNIVVNIRNALNAIQSNVDQHCGLNDQNCHDNRTTECLNSESCWTSSLPPSPSPSPSPSPTRSPTKVVAAEENSNPTIHKRNLGVLTSVVKNFMKSLGKAAGKNAYEDLLKVREALNRVISEVHRECGSKDQDCYNKKTVQYLNSSSLSPSPSPSLGGQAPSHSSFVSSEKMELSFMSLKFLVTHMFLLIFTLIMH